MSLKKLLFSAIALSLTSSYFNAQVRDYIFTQTNGTFTPITTGTPIVTATGTSGVNSLYNITPIDVTIPFDFNFNGTVYRNCKVSSNGFITFGTTPPANSTTSPISGTVLYDGAISAFGKSLNSFADIAGVTGDIRTQEVGVAPNREFVIQWTNFKPTYSTSTTSVYSFSFQIRLKETSNTIDVVYDSGSFLAGSSTTTSTAQIGLRGATNSDFNNRTNNSSTPFINSSAGTANSNTQYYSTSSTAASGMPPAGFTYTWTPPRCTAVAIDTTSSTHNSITFNWSSSSANNYDVYVGTDHTPPTATTTPTQSNIPTNSTTINNLNPNNTYFVWVRSNCGTDGVSTWSTKIVPINTPCVPPALTNVAATPFCVGQTSTLSATTIAGNTIKWYDSATSTTPIGTGSTYTTTPLSANTDFWVSSENSDTYNVGPISPNHLLEPGAAAASTSYFSNITISNSPTTIFSVDVYPNTAGINSTIDIFAGSNTTATNLLYSIPFTTTIASGGTMGQTVPLNVPLQPGNYRIRVSSGSFYRNYASSGSGNAGATFPYTSGNFSITGGSNDQTNAYYFLYNFVVGTECKSPRQQITATVDSACLGTTEAEGKENIKIYPNPFSEIININKAELVKGVKIVDLTGRLIRTINNPTSTLKLQDLQEGLYILVLEMKDGSTQTSKIIKK